MDKLLSIGKYWLENSFHYIRQVSEKAYLNIISNLRLWFKRFRRRRRVHSHQPSSSDQTETKIDIGEICGSSAGTDSPKIDDFCGSKSGINDSGNSTCTDETRSDDTTLPESPNLVHCGNTGWRLVKVELATENEQKSSDSKWRTDGGCTSQAKEEFEMANTTGESSSAVSLTSQMSSSCLDASSSSTLGVCDCEHLKNINADLLAQLNESNKRLMDLEEQLRVLRPQNMQERENEDSEEVIIAQDTSICKNYENTSMKSETLHITSNIPPAPPPPPPPLPMSNWTCGRTHPTLTRKKSVPAPSCPLKTFNWIKLREESLAGTVWLELNDEMMYDQLDLKEIDKHFACSSSYDVYGTIRSRLSVCSAMREVSVLDPRRAQNCAILLSKLKLTYCEIKEAVLTLDYGERIAKDMVEQLLKFIPTKEEVELLAPYQHGNEALHPVDRYFIEISQIPRYEQRLRCLCFKKAFPDTVDELTKKINVVTEASKRVFESKRLRKLLAAVLALGNYMNYSKRNNDASGFHLSALTTLQDVKSSVCSDYTLMHYLVEFCTASAPEMCGVLQETAVCVDAAKINGPEMQLEIKKLKDGLNILSAQIDSCKEDPNGSENRFLEIAIPLLQGFRERYSSMESSFCSMEKAFSNCCKSYSPEDRYEESLNISEFFGYFSHFVNQYGIVEAQIVRKRQEQEIRNLSLSRAKAKKKIPMNPVQSSIFFPCKGRRSQRGTKASADSNEEFLNSLLLAIDQCRSRNAGKNDAILSGRRQRRSIRLSMRRKSRLPTECNSSNALPSRYQSTSDKGSTESGGSDTVVMVSAGDNKG